MSTTYGATGLGQTAASTRRVSSFFKRYWGEFQERRKRQRLRAILCDLSDRELMDIGTTRGEIDYARYRPARHPIHLSNERLILRHPRMIGHAHTHHTSEPNNSSGSRSHFRASDFFLTCTRFSCVSSR